MGLPVLPPQQGLGDILGLSVGRGLEQGLSQSVQDFASQRQRKQAIAQNREKFRGTISSLIDKRLKGSEFDPGERSKLLQESEQIFEKSGDPRAVESNIDNFLTRDLIQRITQPGKAREPVDPETGVLPAFKRGLTRESVIGSLLGNQLTDKEIAQKAIEDPSFAQEAAEDLGVVAADLPFLAAGASLAGPAGALMLPTGIKAVADEVWQQIRDEDKFTISKGGKAALRVADKVAKSALVGGLLSKIPGAKAALKRIPGSKKFLNNFIADKLIDIGATAGTLATAPAVLEGRLPTRRDFGSALALTFGFEALNLPSAIKRNIEIKGEKSKLSPQEFSERVNKRVNEKNIDIEKIQAQKGKELQKFNRVVNEIAKEEATPQVKKVAKVAEEAPKAEIAPEKLKEAEKERRSVIRKAAKSPLEEYFPVEKEVKRKPETVEREKARLSDLKKKQAEIVPNIKRSGKRIFELERELRRASEGEKSAVEKRLESARNTRERWQQKLRDVEFERKNRRAPPTEREIADQIDSSFKKIREDIRNPKKVDPAKVERQVARDKKAIDTAEGLLKRGELPSNVEADTFVKIKKQYNDAYKEVKRINDEIIKDFSESERPAARKKVQDLQKMNKVLEDRIKRSEADIVKQKDKRAIQKMTKGARGAFFKNQLKNLRSDVEAFRDNFFKHKRIRTEKELKAVRVTKDIFKQIPKLTEDFVKNPTEAKATEIAEKTGVSKEEIKDTVSSFGKKINDLFKNKRIPSEKEVKQLTNEMLKKQRSKKRIQKAITTGILINVIQRLSEKFLGRKIPIRQLSFGGGLLALGAGFPIVGGLAAGAATVSSGINFALDLITDKLALDKLKSAQTILERDKIIKELRNKGISGTRINKIRKKARAT